MKINKIIIFSLVLFFAFGAIFFENLGSIKSYFEKKTEKAEILEAKTEIIDNSKMLVSDEIVVQTPLKVPAPIIARRDYSNLIAKISELDVAIIRNDFSAISNLLKILERDEDLDSISFDKSYLKNAITEIENNENKISKLEKFNNFFGNMVKIKYIPQKGRQEMILHASDISIKIKKALEDEQTK